MCSDVTILEIIASITSNILGVNVFLSPLFWVGILKEHIEKEYSLLQHKMVLQNKENEWLFLVSINMVKVLYIPFIWFYIINSQIQRSTKCITEAEYMTLKTDKKVIIFYLHHFYKLLCLMWLIFLIIKNLGS